MQGTFYYAEFEQPHPERTRAILKAHPEVRSLMGRNPFTALIALLVVAVQTAIAFGVSRLGPNGWWAGVLLAYAFGAFANHCTYVIIHDATHNLVFRSRILNKLVAIGADLPNLLPAAISFGIYHLKHHAHQGDYDGWFCPCHGSQYDTSARIRRGPAPANLPLPPYAFLSDTKIQIG